MRLVFISDTHGQHEQLGRLQGDVLIHSGDFCNGFMNDGHSIKEIDDWFSDQEFERVLCVGGNHDFLAQTEHASGKPVFKNAKYLVDESYEFKGVTFYGSPWIPDLSGWAHFLPDNERKTRWNRIPSATDVLITHTPPSGILDQPRSGRHVGCRLLPEVIDRIRPKIHCFGHIHASQGSVTQSGIEYINATVVNSSLEVVYKPAIRDL